ncbi:hypothetical protein [Halobacillus dabanensis]|nr:hypothetical protein [Halobacillus dabanensis]
MLLNNFLYEKAAEMLWIPIIYEWRGKNVKIGMEAEKFEKNVIDP